MEHNLTEEQALAAGYDHKLANNGPASSKKVKKASWVRTILWMFSMVLLANVFMGIIAYFLFFHDK